MSAQAASTLLISALISADHSHKLRVLHVGDDAPPSAAPSKLESPNPIFDFIRERIGPDRESKSPVMMEVIQRCCNMEDARIYGHGSMSWQLNLTHNIIFFAHQPKEEGENPIEGRVALAANTAVQILSMAKEILPTDPQRAQHLHGVGMTLTLMVCHAMCDAPGEDDHHRFAMQHLYRDVNSGDIDAYRNRAGEMIDTLQHVAREQVVLSLKRQIAQGIYNNRNYNGLIRGDLEPAIIIQMECLSSKHLSEHDLTQMLHQTKAILSGGNESQIRHVAWALFTAGKVELFGRELHRSGNYGRRGARAEIDCRFALPERVNSR